MRLVRKSCHENVLCRFGFPGQPFWYFDNVWYILCFVQGPTTSNNELSIFARRGSSGLTLATLAPPIPLDSLTASGAIEDKAIPYVISKASNSAVICWCGPWGELGSFKVQTVQSRRFWVGRNMARLEGRATIKWIPCVQLADRPCHELGGLETNYFPAQT